VGSPATLAECLACCYTGADPAVLRMMGRDTIVPPQEIKAIAPGTLRAVRRPSAGAHVAVALARW